MTESASSVAAPCARGQGAAGAGCPTARLTLRMGARRSGTPRRAASRAPRRRGTSSPARRRGRAPAWRSGGADQGSTRDEQRGEVEVAVVVVGSTSASRRSRRVADDLVERARPRSGEVLADLLGDELEEVLDELGLAREALAQLAGSAWRCPPGQVSRWHTRIITQPGHDERRGREAELLGAEQRRDDDVATGLELAVDLEDDATAQPVGGERLVGLGEPELPRRAGVLERGERRRAGAAVVARDQDHVGVGLGDAGGDRADALLADELHVDARLVVGVLEVVDQLGQVLDGVDVVVRRRRDESHTGRRVAGLGDPRVDLGRRAAGRPRPASRPGPS